MKFLISQQEAQAIVNYLVQQPYGEVVQLIKIMTNLQPAESIPAKEEQ